MDSTFLRIDSGLKLQMPDADLPERQRKAGEVMFADMISMGDMSQTQDFSVDVMDEAIGSIQSEGVETRREKPTDAYEKYQYKDKTIRAESKSVSEEDAKKVEEEITEFTENVTEVIKEELHVSKEEIEAAMEELGLTYLDLLDAGNLANLVAKLSGEANVNQLLCSETFTDILQQVNAFGKELFEELQITPEELAQLQDELNHLAANVNEPEEDTLEVKEDVTAEETTETVEETTNVVVDEATESDSEEMESSGDEATESHFVKTETVRNTDSQTTESHTFTFDASTNTITIEVNGTETVQTLPTYVSVTELIEQFTEQARVHITQDTTKMEMLLNPEHLGKLYLEITEQEGAITAKIQTQNAIVKEALEMQIADLRQNLSQAGVKVDAIEVTIASHEFERNLEQGANSQKQQEEAQSKSARRRNIDMSNLDGLSGLMSEEETIVAKMMAEQGNRVNFTA